MSLLKLASLERVSNFCLSTEAIKSLVVVFPADPVMATTAHASVRRRSQRSRCARASRPSAASVSSTTTTVAAVPVPSALLASLRAGGEAAVRSAGRETISPRFRGPRAARCFDGKPRYAVSAGDPDAIAAEYAAAWHDHRVLESERQELKDRMRAWMEHARLKVWGEFEISDSAPRLAADVRAVAECLRDGEEPSMGLPAGFLLTFSPPLRCSRHEF